MTIDLNLLDSILYDAEVHLKEADSIRSKLDELIQISKSKTSDATGYHYVLQMLSEELFYHIGAAYRKSKKLQNSI